ncbi:MAG TPA: PAS domain-containing sensor histidine kinase [Cyclobacteriaceae bacterium]|nr:PAS domain-containing sensor histidine kinase [Cyclobacteriaceae bacterium]
MALIPEPFEAGWSISDHLSSCMDQLSKIDKTDLASVLDFLPYPFILSDMRGNIRCNIFHNKKFLEEIGYTPKEIPTIEEWFQYAYPDLKYRNEIIHEWKRREAVAKNENRDFIIMQARIHTKNLGYKWYEVKASIVGHFQFIAFVNIDEEIIRKQELHRLNEHKDRILSILSHDLRSPLNNLHGALKVITMDSMTEDEKSELLRKLSNQVFQLSEFIDTTLHWTKMNFSELVVEQRIIDVKKIADSILNLYSTSWLNKNIQTRVSITNRTGAYGDPEVFSIVFRNLISNAIKFTPVGGSIHVYDSYRNQKYVLSVENSGAGISQEKISKIFDKDYISETGTLGEKGLGLGLKLCLQLLEKNGSKLEVESLDARKAIFRIIM